MKVRYTFEADAEFLKALAAHYGRTSEQAKITRLDVHTWISGQVTACAQDIMSEYDQDTREGGARMDPDANLREQENILSSSARGAEDRVRLKELREALWGWLRSHGFEPRWSECPKASKHYKSYGGSNTVGLEP